MISRRILIASTILALTLGLCATASAVTEDNAFAYQGYLEDSGIPINGVMDFQIALYDAAAAGTYLQHVDIGDVAVSGGLFTVVLDYSPEFITGEARWLEIGIRPGASVGAYTVLTSRQQLRPAPYAATLIPGAVMADSDLLDRALLHAFAGDSGLADGRGAYGGQLAPRLSSNGVGVEGYTHELDGYGGYFSNSDAAGVALFVGGSGRILSTAKTKIRISALGAVAEDDTKVDFSTGSYPYLTVRPLASGFQSFFIPIQVPSVLYGVPQRLESVSISHRRTEFVSSTYIDLTEVRKQIGGGNYDNIINDGTNQGSSLWTTYTSYPSAGPLPLIDGAIVVRITCYFYGVGTANAIDIDNIELTLSSFE